MSVFSLALAFQQYLFNRASLILNHILHLPRESFTCVDHTSFCHFCIFEAYHASCILRLKSPLELELNLKGIFH